MDRHILAVASGVVGGYIPNNKSNIHPLLMGGILALLFVKVLLGDLDIGYQWTLSDVQFVLVTALEGVLGASLTYLR